MLKKDEVVKALSAQGPALAASLPGLVSSVTSHVAALAKSKHVPAGVDLAAAQAAVADAGSLWGKAQAAFAAGNVEEAVSTANDVKAKAEAAAAAIKMKLPSAAPAAAAAK
jgi:phosphoenolpyruvate-protein kinase (PTS system EI component)